MNLYKNIPTRKIIIWLEEQLDKILNYDTHEVGWSYDDTYYIDIDKCELINFIEINNILNDLINADTGHNITLGLVSSSLRKEKGGFYPKITIRLVIQ